MFNLSEREKNILIAGIIFIMLFFGFQLGIVPAFEKRDNLDRILKERQLSLEEIKLLKQQYSNISPKNNINENFLVQRKANFTLFSFLDSLVQQSGIKKNVAYMKPMIKKIENSQYMLSIVKVKLQGVHLKEFIDFLYKIESSKNSVNITSLALSKVGSKSDKDQFTLNAIIETQTLKYKDKKN